MHIGKSVRMAQIIKNVSNEELSKDMGVSKARVSTWRRQGNVSHKNLMLLCNYFDMKVSKFIALGENK